MDGHAVSSLDLSQTLPVGGGLLVLYSLSGSPVIKQLMQMVTLVPGQGGRSQSVLNKRTGGVRGKEPSCRCRRRKGRRFDPWVGKVPWRRLWRPTPVFSPGEPLDGGAWGPQSTGSQRVEHG